MATLDVEPTIPNFPAGVQMTVDEFLEWFAENVLFQVSGPYLNGQIDGIAPTTNVGLYIKTSDRKIMLWDGTKYVDIYTIPIGAMFPYVGPASVAPLNYVFAEGQLLFKADYPELYTVATNWGAVGDNTTTTFRVPDMRGRVPMGHGTGNYNPKNVASPGAGPVGTILSGAMKPRVNGNYVGYEWPALKTAFHDGIPTAGGNHIGVISRTINAKAITGGGGGTFSMAPTDWVVTEDTYESIIQPSTIVKFIIKAK